MKKIKGITLALTIGLLTSCTFNKGEQPVPEGCDCTTYSETKYDTSSVWIIETHPWEADCTERVYFDGPIDHTQTGGEKGYYKSYIKCK